MIPVLGIPVLNRPDLLSACLVSIDVDVERLVVVDNSGTGELTDLVLDLRPDAIVVNPPTNLGVAASWNFIVRTTPDAPWWCLANADITFGPSDLERLAKHMVDPAPHIAMLVEYGAFGLNAAVIDIVGWFDENFVPIYCEDTDYRYRCALAGVSEVSVPNTSSHVGSVSYRDNPKADNGRTYPANVAYYIEKWGGFRGQERFRRPFDKPDADVRYWDLDRRRLADLAWRP